MTPWEGLACLRKADLAPADGFGGGFAGLVDGAGPGFTTAAAAVVRAFLGPVGGVAVLGVVAGFCSCAGGGAVAVLSEDVAGSALAAAGEAGVERAARGDRGARPRSLWSILAAALAFPRSRSRLAGMLVFQSYCQFCFSFQAQQQERAVCSLA